MSAQSRLVPTALISPRQRSHRAAVTGEARGRGGADRPEARPAEAPAARRREPEPARSRLALRDVPIAAARPHRAHFNQQARAAAPRRPCGAGGAVSDSLFWRQRAGASRNFSCLAGPEAEPVAEDRAPTKGGDSS